MDLIIQKSSAREISEHGCSASPDEQPVAIWVRGKGAPGRRSLEKKTKRLIEKVEGMS